jgi:hypothetical protein
MANIVSDVCDQLAADLALAFPRCDVSRGARTGYAVDRAKACVFWPGFNELGSAVVVGQYQIIVRYWPVTAKLRNDAPAGVRDPSELEQAALDLAAFLQGKQTAYSDAGAWFIRMQGVQPDYDPEEWGVEARIVLMADNPAVLETR